MRRWATPTRAVGAALALTLVACSDDGSSLRRSTSPPLGRYVPVGASEGLAAFTDCTDFLASVRTQAEALVGPYGLPGGGMVVEDMAFMALESSSAQASTRAVAGPAGAGGSGPPAYSKTNVQEAGVDEPDLVKTDGRLLVAIRARNLHIVDVSGGAPRRLATLDLPDDVFATDLFLDGERALVLGSEAPQGVHAVERTRLTVVDLSRPEEPVVASTLTLDGHIVAARMVDGVVRLVLHSSPQLRFEEPQPALTPDDPAAAEDAWRQAEKVAVARNRDIVARAGVDAWLPRYQLASAGGPTSEGLVVGCDQVAHPAEPAGVGTLTVVSVDPEDPTPGEGVSILAAGETVYASEDNLYVATGGWMVGIPVPLVDGPARTVGAQPAEPPTTELHQFDISDPRKARHVASGKVPGRLLDQFSMDEHDGVLRVATTEEDPNAGPRPDGVPATSSTVTLLRAEEGKLVPVGRVGDLGKGERIYAVRFLDGVGYVVTFRQTDPLYVIDLRDPTRPAVQGELKIPGFSSYLHPLGDGLLLGVGQDATDEGRVQGSQVSLFDVSDPAQPRRVAQVSFGGGHSLAEADHRAFLWWEPAGLAVLPVELWGDGFDKVAEAPFLGAVGLRVSRDGGLAEVGRVTHQDRAPAPEPVEYAWQGGIQRAVVVGDTLYTLSEVGLLASDLATLAPGEFMAW
jgi:uncharacterized secreted protein with C-terminal beta-propeller domain